MPELYSNPWTHLHDSPVDYSQPAVNIVADSCRHIVDGLARKLRITDSDIIEDIITTSYMRSIVSIRDWDTSFPLYNHCWNCVHSVYPHVLRRYNVRNAEVSDDLAVSNAETVPQYSNGHERTEAEEVEADIEYAREMGIEPMFGTYDEYRRHFRTLAIRSRRR